MIGTYFAFAYIFINLKKNEPYFFPLGKVVEVSIIVLYLQAGKKTRLNQGIPELKPKAREQCRKFSSYRTIVVDRREKRYYLKIVDFFFFRFYEVI